MESKMFEWKRLNNELKVGKKKENRQKDLNK